MSDRAADGSARLLGVDVLESVERIVGTDQDDVLHGLPGPAGLRSLFGARGDDTLHAEGATGQISGGRGRDLIVASARLVPQPSGDAEVEPLRPRSCEGDELDTLDLTAVPGVRWSLWREAPSRGSVAPDTFVRAADARDGQDLTGGLGASTYAADLVAGFGTILLGSGDDVVDFTLERDGAGFGLPSFRQVIRGGEGDDDLRLAGRAPTSRDPAPELFGEAGDDVIEIRGGGIGDGGAGNDELIGHGDGDHIALRGGAGDDTISYFGNEPVSVVDGGEGTDLLILAGRNDRLTVNLEIGRASWGEGNLRSFGIEAVAGRDGAETITGSERGDKVSGNGGDDLLLGGGGARSNPNVGAFLRLDGDHSAALAGSWAVAATLTPQSIGPGFQRIVTAQSGDGAQRFSLAIRDGEAHLRADHTGGTVVIQGVRLEKGTEHILRAL